MRAISKEELKKILSKHKKWVMNEEGGEQADLIGADLSGADLRWAYLRWAYLRGADLRWADLRWADLSGADLRGADLSGADLRWADLSGADLRGADLRWADLRGADLIGADLRWAVLEEKVKIKFFPPVCPEEGEFIGWKKADGLIVKLLITGKRSSAYGRKCRCSEAKVLEIQNADGTKAYQEEVHSDYLPHFTYKIGETVSVDDFNEDRWNECSTGIHFFITRQEAVEYR